MHNKQKKRRYATAVLVIGTGIGVTVAGYLLRRHISVDVLNTTTVRERVLEELSKLGMSLPTTDSEYYEALMELLRCNRFDIPEWLKDAFSDYYGFTTQGS